MTFDIPKRDGHVHTHMARIHPGLGCLTLMRSAIKSIYQDIQAAVYSTLQSKCEKYFGFYIQFSHIIDSFSPLMAVCASRCNSENQLLLCASYLIENGADVNSRDRFVVH